MGVDSSSKPKSRKVAFIKRAVVLLLISILLNWLVAVTLVMVGIESDEWVTSYFVREPTGEVTETADPRRISISDDPPSVKAVTVREVKQTIGVLAASDTSLRIWLKNSRLHLQYRRVAGLGLYDDTINIGANSYIGDGNIRDSTCSVVSAGWPWRCFVATHGNHASIPGLLRAFGYSGALATFDREDAPILPQNDRLPDPIPIPVMPLVWGLIANTLLYACTLQALLVGVPAAKARFLRWRRIRKQLCVQCGYSRESLAAGAACPECGAVDGKAGSDKQVTGGA